MEEQLNNSAPEQVQQETEEVTVDTKIEQDQSIDEHPILEEVKDNESTGAYIGVCKWFNDRFGFGFLTIMDGAEKGKDIFCHHSGIRPANSQYRSLKKGEYLCFDVISGEKGLQAVNVRGICNGPLLCDHVQVRKPVAATTFTRTPVQQTGNGQPPAKQWKTVSYHKRGPYKPGGGYDVKKTDIKV
jgi:CspA family cold shock protein